MEKGDIVQITSETHHWFPCLIVVDEVKAWGIQGYALVPQDRGIPAAQAFIRLNSGEFEKVGQVAIGME